MFNMQHNSAMILRGEEGSHMRIKADKREGG